VFLLIYVINTSPNGNGKDQRQEYYQMDDMSNQKFEVGFENDHPAVSDESLNDIH
jgi:hypothetical protein